LAEYRQITRNCAAYALPNPNADVLFELTAGTVVRVLREEDRHYFKAGFGGRPVYIETDSATPSTAESFAQYEETGTAPQATQLLAEPTRFGQPATFWDRLGATVIDFGLWTLIFVGMSVIVTIANAPLAVRLVILVPTLLGGFVYIVYLNANGGTWGKRLVGIRIINKETAAPPGWGTALIRWLAATISALPFYLGYLWMIWDKEKRTWHDYIAGTIVIRSDWHSEEF
jgi:uncharacterized RDD family membrane protein YckC